MSFIDKIAATVMPAASDEDRAQARKKAQQLTQGHDWLDVVLDHHRQIEAAFDKALNASGADAKLAALSELKLMFTGHSNAEESVLYPAVVEYSSKAHATMAYEEQAAAKINFAILENIDPASGDWNEKLEHILSAVQQHVYQEESSWFPDILQNLPADRQQALTKRFSEEYDRYVGERGHEPSHLAPIA